MDGIFSALEKLGVERCLLFTDAASGLRAAMVIDDTTLGPAVGGVRTQHYSTFEYALEDAAALAKSMTVKCALAGLDAGGAKIVIMEEALKNREQAFEVLGRRIQELDGMILTGGDLGTRRADLEAMTRTTEHVHLDSPRLAVATARGLLGCLERCIQVHRQTTVRGLVVAVQGCGVIGAAVARELADAGAILVVSDLDMALAEQVAKEVGGDAFPPDDLLSLDVDVLAPCARSGVLTPEAAATVNAWAVCGAANNILTGPEAESVLMRRGVLYIPDAIASAGAAVEGIGERLMQLSDRTALIDRLGVVAEEVLGESLRTGRLATEIATERARARIEDRRTNGS